jgi:hypothetical protein
MISFFVCTGYKHFGLEPPISFHTRHGDWEFRDNMLYVSVAFNDWKDDQEMLRFVLDTHSSGVNFKDIAKAIKPFVRDNKTPQLHLLIWQHSALTREEMKLSIGTEVPIVERFGQEMVTAEQYIVQRRAYYAAEYARYEAEEQNESKRCETLERERAERRQKREAKVANKKSQP